MADEAVIELPDEGDNIIRTVDPDVVLNPKGLANEIFVHMKKHAKEINQIDAETGKTETFEQVLERSVRVAVNLRKHGVNPKDIITLCSTNHLNTLVVFYATLFLGAIPANINPFTPAEERKEQLKMIKPKFIFAIPEVVDNLECMVKEVGLSSKIVVFGCACSWKHSGNDSTSFRSFLKQSEEDEKKFTPYEVADLYDTAIVVFSSGTTGTPKGVCLHHYSWLMMIGTLRKRLSGFFSFAPMGWISAMITSIMSTISGMSRIVCNVFTPEKAWMCLTKYKPASITVAPHQYMELLRSKKPEGVDFSHIRSVIVAGGGVSLQSRNEGKKLFPNSNINVWYGQTEISGLCIVLRHTEEGIEMFKNKPMMCGMPIRGFTYKIVDPETEEILGANQPGELRVKSKVITSGYYNIPSDGLFDKDGFVKTGDLLYYDEDHCFFFVNRLKEALRYKMCSIAPLELENILMDHPSVKIAVVLGKPSDDGDMPFAVVVKNDDGVTAEELEQLVAEKVDDRKRLRAGVVFVTESEIPITPSGKIKKLALRKHIFDNYYNILS